jgi:hypothetical protein
MEKIIKMNLKGVVYMEIKFGLRIVKIGNEDYEEMSKIIDVDEQYVELEKKYKIKLLCINLVEKLEDKSGYNVYYFDKDENYRKGVINEYIPKY